MIASHEGRLMLGAGEAAMRQATESIRRVLTVAAGLTAAIVASSAEAAPPKELYGKTVTISWTETREQRPVGEQAWRQVHGSVAMYLYVSDAGRIFNNVSYATGAGSAERSGEIAGGGKRSVNFSGQSLQILMPSGAGSATRITADFDAGFSSCSAQVTRATESADTIVRRYSAIIKQDNEIRSTQVGGASCSIKAGNAFGGSEGSRAPQVPGGQNYRR
jgi:hypothetical protein